MNSPGSTTSGIDSVDCESLLWNPVCSDLQREKMSLALYLLSRVQPM